MLLKDKKLVKHTLLINGNVVEEAESNPHSITILEVLHPWCEKYREECLNARKKWLGPESELGKLKAEIAEIAKKSPEEQTDEDKAKVAKLKDAEQRAFVSYLTDPATPHVIAVAETPEGPRELFNNDLLMQTDRMISQLRMKREEALAEARMFANSLVSRSALKFIAIAMEFDKDDLAEEEPNHAGFAIGTAFRNVEPHDVDVFEGILSEIKDNIRNDIRAQMGVNAPEEPKIITPGNMTLK